MNNGKTILYEIWVSGEIWTDIFYLQRAPGSLSHQVIGRHDILGLDSI